MHFPTHMLLARSYSTAIQSLVTGRMIKGIVQSVFARAANLQFEDRLVTLQAYATPCAPNGIILPGPLHMLPLADLQAGMTVIAGQGALYFPDLRLSLHLQHSQPWNPRPVISPAACPTDRLADNLATLVRLLAKSGPKESLAQLALLPAYPATNAPPDASPTVQQAWSSTRSLREALAQQQLEPAVYAAQPLIGLGPGLTPSGDDLLTGLIATTILLGEALEMRPDFYHLFGREVLRRAQKRTTLLSANWIEYATRGEVSASLGHLLPCLVLPVQPLRLAALAGAVLASGATSGADLLAGVILGSQCLLAHRSREE